MIVAVVLVGLVNAHQERFVVDELTPQEYPQKHHNRKKIASLLAKRAGTIADPSDPSLSDRLGSGQANFRSPGRDGPECAPRSDQHGSPMPS